jgi:hypothetical protein
MPPIQQILQQYPQVGILPRSFLLGSDFQQFAAELTGPVEIIRWTWYSFVAYAAGGQVQLLFFTQNFGQAANGYLDTNLQVGGQMSGGEAMVVRNVRVVPIPAQADAAPQTGLAANAIRDWYNVLNLGWLELGVSDKIYVRGAPLTLFPAGQGFGTFHTNSALTGAAFSGTNVSLVQNGDPSNRALWELDPAMYVPATRTVNCALNWRVAQPVTTAGRIGVMLDGWRVRVVQ